MSYSSTSENLSLELHGIVPYFVLLVCESSEVFLTVASQIFLQQPFSFVIELISGLLYTECAVGCAVQHSAFNDTNTISITLTPKKEVEGVASLIHLECCNDTLIEWLKE